MVSLIFNWKKTRVSKDKVEDMHTVLYLLRSNMNNGRLFWTFFSPSPPCYSHTECMASKHNKVSKIPVVFLRCVWRFLNRLWAWRVVRGVRFVAGSLNWHGLEGVLESLAWLVSGLIRGLLWRCVRGLFGRCWRRWGLVGRLSRLGRLVWRGSRPNRKTKY